MKNTLYRMVMLFIVAAITSAVALAHTTRKEVTFSNAVTVNGSLVKHGTYEVRFDDETNQLTIVRDGKLIASAEARLEKVEGSGQGRYVTRYDPTDATKPPELLSVSLNGGNQATIVNNGD